jgi:hypothetical protein
MRPPESARSSDEHVFSVREKERLCPHHVCMLHATLQKRPRYSVNGVHGAWHAWHTTTPSSRSHMFSIYHRNATYFEYLTRR